MYEIYVCQKIAVGEGSLRRGPVLPEYLYRVSERLGTGSVLMTPHTLEHAAVSFLHDHGFSAEIIEEASGRTPDIRAIDSAGKSYLLEVKQRTVGWHEQAEPRGSAEGLKVMSRIDPGGPSNTVSGVIEHGVRQLASVTPNDESILRLIWFFADPSDREYHYRRIQQTAYGTRVVIAQGGESLAREGMYVGPAAFVRWRNVLDGILLGAIGGILLNDLSPRYEQLKKSHLTQLCGDVVLDPVAAVASGQCYYLQPDCTVPNTRENVIKRLESAYAIRVIDLVDIPRFSAAALVPER